MSSGFAMPTPSDRPKSGEEVEKEKAEEHARNILPDDAKVDVTQERKEYNSDEVLDRLERELVGLVPVKNRIREIADLLVADRLRHKFGIDPADPRCTCRSPAVPASFRQR